MSTKNYTPLVITEDGRYALQTQTIQVGGKEIEPKPPQNKTQEASLYMESSEVEPSVEDEEVSNYVEIEKKEIELHPDLKKAGLQAVQSSSLDPKHNVQLPISDEKVIQGLEKPVTSSWRWLAELSLFLLRQAHLTLKKVHGKVVRVLQ